MQVFLSYARSEQDSALARFLANGLRSSGLDVWLDEERLPPGTDPEASLRLGVDTSDAAIFLISRLWVERDWTRWELTQFARREPRCERMLPVLRGPRLELERLIPPYLSQLNYLEWPPDASDAPSRFWQLLCGVSAQPPGPRSAWALRGDEILGVATPPPPVALPTAPFDPRAPRIRAGQARLSLRCDRSALWGMVDAHAREPTHETMVVRGPRGAGHSHFLVRVEQELRRDPPRCMIAVQWKVRPRTQQDFLEALADALGVGTGPRTNMRANVSAAIRARLTHQNLVLLHPVILDRFDDEEIRRYYGETWPALLPSSSPSWCVKCVQPIEWRAVAALKRVGARVAMTLWPGLTHSEWVAQGADEAKAADLVRDLQACTSPSFRIHPLPPLGDIPDAEIDEFCQRLGLSTEQAQRLLDRVRSVSRTPEDFLKAIDDYYPEVCGA